MEKEFIFPKVSIIICTLNCKEDLKNCLKGIQKQDYPKTKIEIIIVDSYSRDGTIELAKSFGAKVILTKIRGYMEGRGMPKAIGCDKAKGEIIVTIDSDNTMVEKDWIQKAIYPLMDDSEISFTISRMAFVKTDNKINRYLSLGPGTDPFSVYGSVDPQFAMGNLKMEDKGKYWKHKMKPKNFLVTGGYYFAIKKKTLIEQGGYIRDVDNTWILTKRGKGVFAIPKESHLHHKITSGFFNFLRQKIKWSKFYFDNPQVEREFNWQKGFFGKFGKIRFFYEILRNLLFFPAFFVSLKLIFRQKRPEWILHAPMKFATTLAYLFSWIRSY
jgi:glycosyltransferase involved in cell wall biosynthesis